MSAIESARNRYRTFDDQRYAPPMKGVGLFGLLTAPPTIIEIDVAGMELVALLSLKALILTVICAYTAQAWNIVSGYTGQFSFGHAAFFGVGTYATQTLVVDFAANPWVGILVGGVIAAGYGLVVGTLSFCFNLQGHYFALATLAFAELLCFVVTSMSGLRGANGYFEPFPHDYGAEYGLAASQFQSDPPYYYLIVGFLLVMTLVSWVTKNSWVGLYFFAVREDERAAASVGVPSFRYRLIGAAVSAFFIALDGTYWSIYFNAIRPDTVLALLKNIEPLLPAVVGGPGTLLGPIVGSFIVTPISEIARTTFSDINGLDRIIYGAFLVAIVIYSPRGVVSWPGQARALWTRVRDDEEVSE